MSESVELQAAVSPEGLRHDLNEQTDFSERATLNGAWVNVQSIHNALIHNHFMDILEVYGARCNLKKDSDYPGYDPAGCFSLRMQRLSVEFRRQVTGAFARRVGFPNVECISARTVAGPADEERNATKRAMEERKSMIVGAIVGDEDRRLYARIPILIRVDVAKDLLNVDIQMEDDVRGASSLYIPIGIKRRPLDTSANGIIKNRSLERMQIEMWLWNQLLNGIQGYDMQKALLVGLNPRRERPVSLGAELNAESLLSGGNSVFDLETWQLAIVPFDSTTSALAVLALEALQWRVHVVDHGSTLIAGGLQGSTEASSSSNEVLRLAKSATDARWRPNMKCASMYDWPWARAKRKLATEVGDITLVSGISREVTATAMAKSIPNDYQHASVTAESLGVTSQFTKVALIMSKPDYNGPPVVPKVIPHNRFNWRRLQNFNETNVFKFDKVGGLLPQAEQRTFYVDFELASPENLYAPTTIGRTASSEEKYSTFFDVSGPESALVRQEAAPIDSDALIFMIGCGQLIEGEWKHTVFTARSLSREGEEAIVSEWLSYMHSISLARFGAPFLNVWGPEKSLLRKAMRRMSEQGRAELKDKRQLKYVDMLQVVTTGCLVIQGNLTNSLKAVMKSLDRLNLLNECGARVQEDNVTDGGDAMAVALEAEEARRRGEIGELSELEQMKEVARYNEADCRDIARLAAYLREHH